jgi:hypothetical protein
MLERVTSWPGAASKWRRVARTMWPDSHGTGLFVGVRMRECWGGSWVEVVLTSWKVSRGSDEKGVPCQAPCFDKMREHFLTPKAVRWAGAIPYIRKKVVDVACGGFHILVAASDSSSPALYTSGLNQYGQLGHGDLVDRHELTRVTSIDNMALFAGLLVRRS